MQASTSQETLSTQPGTSEGPGKRSPLLSLLSDTGRSVLIKQGAEAKVYKIQPLLDVSSSSPEQDTRPQPSLLLKHRFAKAYRHTVLDKTLTKSRVNHEVKCLARCLKAGLDVPAVRGVDVANGIILMEWIDGYGSVREVLGGLPEDNDPEDEATEADDDLLEEWESTEDRLLRLGLEENAIMKAIGQAIGGMHKVDVIHGDLTTSNMLLRRTADSTTGRHLDMVPEAAAPTAVLIDFGLSYVSTLVEDKAVDLYVLERALASTHPEDELRENKNERYIEKILAAYATTIGEKEWQKVERRLKDVRLRGRKRSMVG